MPAIYALHPLLVPADFIASIVIRLGYSVGICSNLKRPVILTVSNEYLALLLYQQY